MTQFTAGGRKHHVIIRSKADLLRSPWHILHDNKRLVGLCIDSTMNCLACLCPKHLQLEREHVSFFRTCFVLHSVVSGTLLSYKFLSFV